MPPQRRRCSGALRASARSARRARANALRSLGARRFGRRGWRAAAAAAAARRRARAWCGCMATEGTIACRTSTCRRRARRCTRRRSRRPRRHHRRRQAHALLSGPHRRRALPGGPPGRRIFASGQKAFVRGGHSQSAPLLVWDSTALPAAGGAPLATLTGVHESAVTSVAFSADGGRLVSAGLDAMHTVALWDWQKGECLLRTASSPRAVRALASCCRAPTEDGTDGGAGGDATGGGGSAEARVVVCGEGAAVWDGVPGAALAEGGVRGAGRAGTLPCVAVNSDGRVLTGTRRCTSGRAAGCGGGCLRTKTRCRRCRSRTQRRARRPASRQAAPTASYCSGPRDTRGFARSI